MDKTHTRKKECNQAANYRLKSILTLYSPDQKISGFQKTSVSPLHTSFIYWKEDVLKVKIFFSCLHHADQQGN